MVWIVSVRVKCGGSSPFDFAQGQNDNYFCLHKYFLPCTSLDKLRFHGAGVDGHAGYCVYAHGVEGFDFALLLDASGDD